MTQEYITKFEDTRRYICTKKVQNGKNVTVVYDKERQDNSTYEVRPDGSMERIVRSDY